MGGIQDYGVICMGVRTGGSYYVEPGQWDDVQSVDLRFLCEWNTVNTNLQAGTVFIDSKTNSTYKITNQNSTVEYIKPFNKNEKKSKISGVVKLGAVKYKVTSVKDNAFKAKITVLKKKLNKYKKLLKGAGVPKSVTVK